MFELVCVMVQEKIFVNREKNTTRYYYKVWLQIPSDPSSAGWLYSDYKPSVGSKVRVAFRSSNSKEYDGQLQAYIVQPSNQSA